MDQKKVENLLKVKEANEKMLLNKPNVVGVDVGYKYVGGKRTDEIATRVFVKKKMTVAQNDAIPDSLNGEVTDVIEEERVELQLLKLPESTVIPQAVTGSYNPLVGGISVGPCRSINGFIYVGTLGSPVQKDGTYYALSNFHVLAVDDSWKKGDDITQPGRNDGGSCPNDTIGTLDSACLGSKYSCNNEPVDAATSTTVKRKVSNWILNIGGIQGSTLPTLGTAVRKQGRTTGLTYGTIDGLGRTVSIDYGDGIGTVTLTNQVSIVPDTSRNLRFSDHGDSGSVVVDDNVQVLGLLFAGSSNGSRTYANVFSDVESALGVSINPLSWGPSIQYDTGGPNAVAMDDNGNCLEVHVGTNRLFYRVGKANFSNRTVSWGSSTQYDTGGPNAVAMDANGNCVEVHVGTDRLFYRVGKVNFTNKTVSWGTSTQYDTGGPNAVAMDANGNCVEVHVGTERLFYRVGKVNFTNKTISWGSSTQYDTGGPNAVAMDDNGNCVEVHVGTDRLFYRVGKVNFTNKTISWGPSTQYDTGGPNAVTMDGSGNCLEVHVGTGRLFYRVGKVNFTNKTITWGPSTQYDTGGPNAIAIDNLGNSVEVHVGTDRLFDRVGKLILP